MKTLSRESIKRQWRRLIADKRRRNLLAAGAVLLFFGLVYRLYPVYEGMRGGETDIAAVKNRVAKYRGVADGKEELEARLASLRQALNKAEEGLLAGKTESLAAVDVQNSLNEIAFASGVEIKSMQVLRSQARKQEDSLYIAVPVQFSVTLSTRQLKDILYRIESFQKFYLMVQWIRISAAGPRDAGQIRCDIAVAGIMKNIKE